MKLLLEEQISADPNMIDEGKEYTMLTYAYRNKKHQAFELIV